MSLHKVLRPFPYREPLKTGQIVDTTNWRNKERLVRQRYLAPVEAEVSNPEPSTDEAPVDTVEAPPTSPATAEAQPQQPRARNRNR